MNDWIGLGIIGFLILCGLFGLSRISKPYEVSTEEFEKRAQEGPSLLGAGVAGLQKFLDPAMERAAEVQEDYRQGYLDGEQESGEPPEADQDGDETITNGEPDA